MWVIGGDNSGARKTTELVDINAKNSIMLEDELPFELEEHCATQINSTYGIITGGDDGAQRKTFIVNLNNFDVSTGPTLRKERRRHSCSRISAANGTDYVIVVGGVHYTQTSEILVGNSWKDGMYLLSRITKNV